MQYALSIRQPWAWLILNAGKDIENRNWYTSIRGRFRIHAAMGCTEEEYDNAVFYVRQIIGVTNIPPMNELERGGIVGSVELVDCVTKSDSRWFFGQYGFVLRNPEPLPFMPCRGQLGFFKVEDV